MINTGTDAELISRTLVQQVIDEIQSLRWESRVLLQLVRALVTAHCEPEKLAAGVTAEFVFERARRALEVADLIKRLAQATRSEPEVKA